MKKHLLLLALILSNLLSSQGFEKKDGKIVFTKVIETTKNKDEIYKAIKLWLNETPNKSKNFIDLDDPNLGIISFNMVSIEYPLSIITKTQIEYKVTIEIKDAKFRFKASDFSQKYNIYGTKVSLPFEDLSDESKINERISKLEEERKSLTKEKKIKEIDSKIADEKTELGLKRKASEDFNNSIENLPNSIKEKVENYSDF